VPEQPAQARPPAPDPAFSALLALQHGVGNQAVGRVLARRTVGAKPRKGTGMRDDAAIARYVHRAVIFLRNNPDAALHHFARFLGAAANVQLNQLGVPDMRIDIKGRGGGGAHFDAASWSMFIDSDGFTHRENVTVLRDLTEDEAAIIAMTVWHEARHAEQRFRVARMQAGERVERGFEMEDEAAAAAAEAPLEPRAMPAGELAEAREWRENQIGEDALYREVVTAWQGDVKVGARLARGVTAADAPTPEEVRERIGRMLTGWSKPGGAMDVIRSHLPSAQRRRRATIIADVQAMIARFEAAETEWRALGAAPARWDFVDLAEALRELVRAIDTAYRNQPVEKDAHEVGHKTFDAFHAELAKPGPGDPAAEGTKIRP
jgi:hypothetical protein